MPLILNYVVIHIMTFIALENPFCSKKMIDCDHWLIHSLIHSPASYYNLLTVTYLISALDYFNGNYIVPFLPPVIHWLLLAWEEKQQAERKSTKAQINTKAQPQPHYTRSNNKQTNQSLVLFRLSYLLYRVFIAVYFIIIL